MMVRNTFSPKCVTSFAPPSFARFLRVGASGGRPSDCAPAAEMSRREDEPLAARALDAVAQDSGFAAAAGGNDSEDEGEGGKGPAG